MNLNPFIFIVFGGLFLNGCGGGNSPEVISTSVDNEPSLISGRLLADNTVRLTLNGLGGTDGRYCIRQDAATPLSSDPCFTDSSASTRIQEKSITNPSNALRVVFTAWVLEGGMVRRHASVSLPGRTCSAAAYNALQATSSPLPAVCILTGTSTALQESVLLLESVKAPISSANFLRYVNQGFYDQTVFHRFLKGSSGVVQGGGFTHNGTSYVPKTATLGAIPLESTFGSGLSNTTGTIAMARTNEPDTATAGFFVNTINNPGFNSSNLRDGYAVFGRFVHGTNSWSELLNSVSGGNEVINPSPIVRLHWAYQIQ